MTVLLLSAHHGMTCCQSLTAQIVFKKTKHLIDKVGAYLIYMCLCFFSSKFRTINFFRHQDSDDNTPLPHFMTGHNPIQDVGIFLYKLVSVLLAPEDDVGSSEVGHGSSHYNLPLQFVVAGQGQVRLSVRSSPAGHVSYVAVLEDVVRTEAGLGWAGRLFSAMR